jgi:FMN reductase
MTSLVVVSAGLSVPSSTRLLADHLLTGFPGPALASALDAVRRADALIAA